MKLFIALILSAALVALSNPAKEQINNSTTERNKTKVQAVQAEVVRKPSTHQPVQEKALTEQPAVVEPEPVAQVTVANPQPLPEPQPLTDRQALMEQAGIPRHDWSAVEYIIHKESTWRPTATNNIGCIGLGQSCPGGSGLTQDCPDWQTNPVCQLRHFSKYAATRYGSWQQALAFWDSKGWW